MNNTNEDVVLKEEKLQQLINKLESKANEINDRFKAIKTETEITNGSNIWTSKAQESFKGKKDKYISQFDIVSEELKTQISLLKKAKEELRAAEEHIQASVDYNV